MHYLVETPVAEITEPLPGYVFSTALDLNLYICYRLINMEKWNLTRG